MDRRSVFDSCQLEKHKPCPTHSASGLAHFPSFVCAGYKPVVACTYLHTQTHALSILVVLCRSHSLRVGTHARIFILITLSTLVPLIEGLCNSNPWELEFSGFRRNRTDNLGINSPLLCPTEPQLHVRSHLIYVVCYTDPLLFLFERTRNYPIDNQRLLPQWLRCLG